MVTLCAPVHLEGFGDIETVARTKGQIVSSLGADGVAVINDDDAFAPLWRELAGSRRTIGFGLGAASEVRASDLAVGVDGASFTLHVGGTSGRARIAHPGTHNVRNALAAAAAASAAGVTFETVVRGLAAARPVGGRLQTRRGPHGARIIEEILTELRDEHGTTILMVAHDLAMVRRVADFVTGLNRRAIFEGPAAQLADEQHVDALFGVGAAPLGEEGP